MNIEPQTTTRPRALARRPRLGQDGARLGVDGERSSRATQ
jgi:hypothetical protein